MTTETPQELIVRKACLKDVNEIFRIVNYYAESQLMLPKTHLQIYENIRDYSVVADASVPDKILACGALHIYWEDLAEIRAIAVTEGMSRRGIGTILAERLLEEAVALEIDEVFCFTYVPGFFNRLGFIQVEHSALPLKVYNECFNCSKFNKCDEIAMVIHL